jgi:hypothetical protein
MDVFILLDRTGSMTTLWKEAVTSVNTFVSELKKEKKRHKVTLAVFDYHEGSTFDILRDAVPISKWEPLRTDEVAPRGMTPLLDAVAKIVAKAEEAKPKQAVIVVMTDGHENASREVTKEQAKAAIERVKEKNWQVVFLGANFDAFDNAYLVGLDAGQTISFAAGHAKDAIISTVQQAVYYANTGQSMCYSAQDRKKAGEDLVKGTLTNDESPDVVSTYTTNT